LSRRSWWAIPFWTCAVGPALALSCSDESAPTAVDPTPVEAGAYDVANHRFDEDGGADRSVGASADARLPAAMMDALAADGELQVVEHNAVPINFACPNVIVQSADGVRTGMSDAASPWSGAVAQA